MKDLDLDYMEHDQMHMKGYGRGPCTSRNLKVMGNLYMVSVDVIKVVQKIHVITTCLFPYSFKSVDT